MDIQADKIELAKLILSTNDTGLINKVKALFKNDGHNLWDELPQHIQQGINESIAQADRGEFVSLEDVKKEVNTLLKK
ncbi:hypothetical protein [Mucilaginibacter ginsenosidivorans]|uniref:Addiction module protein n=1 Tax=Mucilaginibacter ginsenosidivorans TaxID=398053 RepID=A0A5B8UU25_9SPHI|nr:hypothetical protein [Mucilaginibacter ginsenosidivorans]QEC62617.1 hypothetical protein FRZ54_08460 [Mucilaginibacter ginsenosidivorans]